MGYLLAREGLAPNHKKLLRLYREEGLTRCAMPCTARPHRRFEIGMTRQLAQNFGRVLTP
jgi:hypothetical protein